MKIAAGIAGILLGLFSLLYVGIFGSMVGATASWLGSIPFRGNTAGPWGEMVSMLSWLAPLLTIAGGVVTFASPRVGGVILGVSAFLHWQLLGLGQVGKLFVFPIGATAVLALLAKSSAQSVTNLAVRQTYAEPATPGVATGPRFDRAKWNALVQYDKDIAAIADKLRPLGQKWLDEFASSYLALNDKQYLPAIEQKIVAAAKAEAVELEQTRIRLEEKRKATQLEQERLAQEREKRLALWGDRLWRYRGVAGGILLSLVVGVGYFYYQKQETEKLVAAEKQREEDAKTRAEAETKKANASLAANFTGIWEFEQDGSKQYFKVSQQRPGVFKFHKGYKWEGKLVWAELMIKNSDGIYLKSAAGKLKGEFVSENFFATHGIPYTYKITLDPKPDNKLLYSVYSPIIRGGETDARVAIKIGD